MKSKNKGSKSSQAKNNQAAPEPTDFNGCFELSKQYKDEANQEIKVSYDKALANYQKSILVFLKNIPKFVIEQNMFQLDWKLEWTPEQQKQVKEHFAIVFSNCSLIYLEKRSPLYALYYANFSKWCNPDFLKADLRRGKAMIDLLYVHESRDILQDLVSKTTDPAIKKEADAMLEQIEKIIAEHSSPKKVIQFLTNGLDWSLEKAYKGPYTVVDIPGRQRGVCAARDIDVGEIILIEKGITYKGSQNDFCYHFLKQLDNEEEFKGLYLNLFTCAESPQPNKEQAEEALTLLKNRSSLKWKTFTDQEIDNFLNMVQCYSFQANESPELFANAGLCNHSCDPNTSQWTINDMILILAQRKIMKGEEICISYIKVSGDKLERKALLDKYRFECSCARCQRIQEWEIKEAKLAGLKCPTCGTEFTCNSEKQYACPKGCWSCDHQAYKNLTTKTIAKLDELLEESEKNDEAKFRLALDTLAEIRKQFSDYHYILAYALRIVARFYAYKKQESEYKDFFNQFRDIVKFYPNPEYRSMVTDLLYVLCLNFGREPTTEELEPFEYFGLTLDVTKGLWQRSVKK